MKSRKKPDVIVTQYVKTEIQWYWFIRKTGFLQPTPYVYAIPDLKILKNYANGN